MTKAIEKITRAQAQARVKKGIPAPVYWGKVCDLHPHLEGRRRRRSCVCTGCTQDNSKVRYQRRMADPKLRPVLLQKKAARERKRYAESEERRKVKREQRKRVDPPRVLAAGQWLSPVQPVEEES